MVLSVLQKRWLSMRQCPRSASLFSGRSEMWSITFLIWMYQGNFLYEWHRPDCGMCVLWFYGTLVFALWKPSGSILWLRFNQSFRVLRAHKSSIAVKIIEQNNIYNRFMIHKFVRVSVVTEDRVSSSSRPLLAASSFAFWNCRSAAVVADLLI